MLHHFSMSGTKSIMEPNYLWLLYWEFLPSLEVTFPQEINTSSWLCFHFILWMTRWSILRQPITSWMYFTIFHWDIIPWCDLARGQQFPKNDPQAEEQEVQPQERQGARVGSINVLDNLPDEVNRWTFYPNTTSQFLLVVDAASVLENITPLVHENWSNNLCWINLESRQFQDYVSAFAFSKAVQTCKQIKGSVGTSILVALPQTFVAVICRRA